MPGLSLGFMIEERSSREAGSAIWAASTQSDCRCWRRTSAIAKSSAAGPDPFMRAVRQMLDAAGFDMTKYHQESFAAPAVEEFPAPFALPGEGGAVVPAEAVTAIRFALSDVTPNASPDRRCCRRRDLRALRIPAACEFGLCGTCKVKKNSGEVEMSHNGGILDHEIDDGFILACCSKPRFGTRNRGVIQ